MADTKDSILNEARRIFGLWKDGRLSAEEMLLLLADVLNSQRDRPPQTLSTAARPTPLS
jgi:hypothetical protein